MCSSDLSFGATAGVKADVSDLSVVVTGYIGKGLGTTLMFSGGEVAADGTTARPSDGGYAQLMYKVGPKTNVGASWGFSRLKTDETTSDIPVVMMTSEYIDIYDVGAKGGPDAFVVRPFVREVLANVVERALFDR